MKKQPLRMKLAGSGLAFGFYLIVVIAVLVLPAAAQHSDSDRGRTPPTGRFAVFAGYEFLRAGETPAAGLNGWKTAFSWRAMKWASLRIEAGEAFGHREGRRVGRQIVLVGPEIKLYSNQRMRAYLLGMAGYIHERTGSLAGTPNTSTRARACIWSIGGGVDVRMTRRASYRVEYLPNFFPGEWQNHSGISTGLVFHFGGS